MTADSAVTPTKPYRIMQNIVLISYDVLADCQDLGTAISKYKQVK